MSGLENGFFTRRRIFDGIGTNVEGALTSEEAIKKAGLDWEVVQRKLYTEDGMRVNNVMANVRDSDQRVMGIVSNKYSVLQNSEAFAFTDSLVEEAGMKYVAAGCTNSGLVFLCAQLPEHYILNGDEFSPYLLFLNSHAGDSKIRCAMIPHRIVCQNMINVSLASAKRIWGVKHVGDITSKLDDARETLFNSKKYMAELGKSLYELEKIKLSDSKVNSFIEELYPATADMSDIQYKNAKKQQDELKRRFFDAPDLQDVGQNGYKMINAVANMVGNSKPLRETPYYRENVFRKSVESNTLLDKTYAMLQAA